METQKLSGKAQSTPAALTADDLRETVGHPHHVVELVLSRRRRLAATLAGDELLWRLAALMLMTTLLGCLPFGLVLGLEHYWKVPLLFLGSLAICFPSLHLFGAYFGARASLRQNLCAALLISSVAGLFCLAFAPILLFLDATIHPMAEVSTGHLALALLAAALLAGLAHLSRCLGTARLRRTLGLASGVLGAWVGLLLFITYRMAGALGLL